MKIKYRWNSNWTYNGDFLDFIDAGPEAWGCCVTTIILVCSLAFAGYGITKLCNNKSKKAETEITTKNIITFNNIKTR